MTAATVFAHCVKAIRNDVLIERVSDTDKEFHFQNWFKARLLELGENFEVGGRNSYPDFRMVAVTDGYELKGLAYPGATPASTATARCPPAFTTGARSTTFSAAIPKRPDGNSYPVLDLVLCHGDFLNADHEYVHENRSVKGFGSYGDILIRDRKMYVVPTPFRLVEGIAHQQTLILPAEVAPGQEFVSVGDLCRREAPELIVGYTFDLQSNELRPAKVPNPGAGREHHFRAWRTRRSPASPVSLRCPTAVAEPLESDDEACRV